MRVKHVLPKIGVKVPSLLALDFSMLSAVLHGDNFDQDF